MLTKSQQATYRPLVDAAWLAHCRLEGCSPNNKPAKDAWYRDQVHSACGVWSTRDADPKRDYPVLLERFQLLSGEPQPVYEPEWTPAQSARFHDLAAAAWEAERLRGAVEPGIEYERWLHAQYAAARVQPGRASRKQGFDRMMGILAVAANNEYWMERTAGADETRYRYQIRRFMRDLEWLRGETVTWDYVRAIYDQSQMLPDLDDAPAATLELVLSMLDTHIRRLCRERDLRPMCLPTRCLGPRPSCSGVPCQRRNDATPGEEVPF